MTAKGISLDNAGFEYPAEYSMPSAKKARLQSGTDVTSQHPELAYPDTDEQYPDDTPNAVASTTSETAASSMTAEEYAKYCEDYYINYLATQNIPIGDYGGASEGQDSGDVDVLGDTQRNNDGQAPQGWIKCVDEDTGAIYYFNETTQESSWGLPSAA